MLNIVFSEIPPFLLFDIASSFRDKINLLSEIEMYNRRPIGQNFSKIKAHRQNLFRYDYWH